MSDNQFTDADFQAPITIRANPLLEGGFSTIPNALIRLAPYLDCGGEDGQDRLRDRQIYMLVIVLALHGNKMQLRLSNLPMTAKLSTLESDLRLFRKTGLVFTQRNYYPPVHSAPPRIKSITFDMRSLVSNLLTVQSIWFKRQNALIEQWQTNGARGSEPVYQFPDNFRHPISVPRDVLEDIALDPACFFPKIDRWIQAAQTAISADEIELLRQRLSPTLTNSHGRGVPTLTKSNRRQGKHVPTLTNSHGRGVPTLTKSNGHLKDDDLKDDEGEDRPAHIFDTDEDAEAIRALFAKATQKANYELTAGDLKAITRLSKLGATLDEVRQGITAILNSGKKPKTFAYCAPHVETLCKNRLTEPRQPNAKPTPPQPTSAWQAEAATEPRQPNTTQPTTVTIPEELQASVDIFKRLTGNNPTTEQIAVMESLASLADEAARKIGETGAQWLYAALNECSYREGIRSPLRYAATTIRNRVSAPAPPKKNGNGSSDPTPSAANDELPEVEIYRYVTGFAPRSDQVDSLVEKFSGTTWNKKYLLPFWREWCARDHKRHNLGWLDWAQAGRIPKPAQRAERKKTVRLT